MIRLYNNLHVYIKMLAVISNQNETASNPTASNLKSGTWENIKSKEGNFSKRIRKMPRDPYPFPRYENDNEFSSHSNLEISNSQNLRESMESTSEPWNKLYEKKTLASSRREVFHHDPQAPTDSLDFVIKSVYDHHSEFLQSNAQTLYQPETLGLPHGRKLKNRNDKRSEANCDNKKVNLKFAISEKRENIDSVKGAIPSHHSAATNRGYSRKHDGGFYGC